MNTKKNTKKYICKNCKTPFDKNKSRAEEFKKYDHTKFCSDKCYWLYDLSVTNSLEIWADKCIEDAIHNIKNRRLRGDNKNGPYNLANWVKDWYWLTDDESTFSAFCKLAGYQNSEELVNETLRLAKARIEDGIKETQEWALGEDDIRKGK